ncbi:Ig-like domain-containing protein [Embleya sp. NPDC005575]|uniref:Ig-like domain-containing protein n=1 Tax=Embleya sp. NPDC005575 TaxID=3156892 RepID=UPI0033AFF388
MPAVPGTPEPPIRVRRVGAVLACCAALLGAVVGTGHPAASMAPIPSHPPVASVPPGASAAGSPADRVRPTGRPGAPVPPAPRAGADRVATRAGQSVDVPVLAGDTGEGLVVLSHTNPEHGLVLDLGDSRDTTTTGSVLRYTPGPGFAGRDGFHYTVVDRLGRQATASVRIDVAADPGAARRTVEPRTGRLGAHRGVDEFRAPSAGRARAGHDSGDGPLLVAFLGSALLGVGVLAWVAFRRPGRRPH